jgi:hypothetical protein
MGVLAIVMLFCAAPGLLAAIRMRAVGLTLSTVFATAVNVGLAAAGLGKAYVHMPVGWLSAFRAVCGVLVMLWTAYCVARSCVPIERHTIDEVAERIPKPAGLAGYLSRQPYKRGRIFGVSGGTLMGLAAWWLLETAYTKVAEQRWPLDVLKAVVQEAHTN